MDDGDRAVGSDSPPVDPLTRPLKRRWARAVDGERLWGSIDFWPNRYGFRKYRLVVFPPGINPTERRYVRLARSWPVWGTTLWLILAAGLGGQGELWSTIAYPTAAFVLSGAVTFALAGSARMRVRTLSAILIEGYADERATAQYTQLELLARTLVVADAMHDRGELTVVDHETVWWKVYDALSPEGQANV